MLQVISPKPNQAVKSIKQTEKREKEKVGFFSSNGTFKTGPSMHNHTQIKDS